MSLFGPSDLPPVEPSEATIAQALLDVKREARNRRIALVAPVVLASAVLVAFVAAPPRHGGLTLVPEAEASDDDALPRVFGANGVWRLAEPIGEAHPTVPGPPWRIEFPAAPDSPDYVLEPPTEPDGEAGASPVGKAAVSPASAYGEDRPLGAAESFSASASTPPTPTLGQSETSGDRDWTAFQPPIRLDVDDATDSQSLAPVASEPAEATPVSDHSSADEDVPDPSGSVPTGDAADSAASAAGPADADTGDHSEANPSTPQADPISSGAQPESAVATIVPIEVLVHSAHVSVTVQVVDDDSSVIDWCNTRVDWGDGSVTGVLDADGIAACAAPCERVATPSGVGMIEQITFTHEYSVVIDAAPRVFVATGDGCSYLLAELQLSPFTVVPY